MTKAIKKSKEESIENTGERMVPAFQKGNLEYGEHIVRYEGLTGLVDGKVVLDIASGSGYGTEIIARSAKKVFGVDYSHDAVKYAKTNFSTPKTTFLQGDATAIPLDDKSVDVVVSFETLEHIDKYEKFMQEIKRVLKPDGLLVLSTPNDVEFPEDAHFHIHEFEHQELKKLVKKYFKNLKPYYQVTWKYNALLEEKAITKPSNTTMPTLNVAPVGLEKVLYFYFLCSNRAIKEIVKPVGAMSEHWSTRGMLTHNAEMDKYIRKTMKHYEGIIAKKDVEISDLRNTITSQTEGRNVKRVAGIIKKKAKKLRS